MKLNKNLNFKFNEINFSVVGEVDFIKKLYIYWKYTIDVAYSKNEECDWLILINIVNINDDEINVDYDNKVIEYYVNNCNALNKTNSLIREFITKYSLSKGYIWLHGSAFLLKGKSYIILGKKGAGKSTHLLNACLNYGARLIVNDQIPVRYHNNNIYIYKWRPDVKFSPSTLHVIGIKEKISINTSDKLYWMPKVIQNKIINFKDLSRSRNQKIVPYNNKKIKIADGNEFKIDRIIILDDIINPCQEVIDKETFALIWNNLFIKDNENLMPNILEKWNDNVGYWNKRIINMKLCKSAVESSEKSSDIIINNVYKIRMYNRIKLEKCNAIYKESE